MEYARTIVFIFGNRHPPVCHIQKGLSGSGADDDVNWRIRSAIMVCDISLRRRARRGLVPCNRNHQSWRSINVGVISFLLSPAWPRSNCDETIARSRDSRISEGTESDSNDILVCRDERDGAAFAVEDDRRVCCDRTCEDRAYRTQAYDKRRTIPPNLLLIAAFSMP